MEILNFIFTSYVFITPYSLETTPKLFSKVESGIKKILTYFAIEYPTGTFDVDVAIENL